VSAPNLVQTAEIQRMRAQLKELRDQMSEQLSEAARRYANGAINLDALEASAVAFAECLNIYKGAPP
jgi:hypothetical protein